jgi:hypothetical protein
MQERAVKPSWHVRWIVCGSAHARTNDRHNAEPFGQVAAVVLTVVPGISNQRRESMPLERCPRDLPQVRLLGRRTATTPAGQRQMRIDVDHLGEFWIAAMFSAGSTQIMLRDVPRLQAGGIDTGQRVSVIAGRVA